MSSATCNGFPLPPLQDMLQGKSHSVTPACSVQSLQAQRNSLCNLSRNFVAEGRTKLYFAQLLQAEKKLGDKLQKGHVIRCNLPAAGLATPLREKLRRKFHRVTLVVELYSTSCKHCRDLLKPLHVTARDCNVCNPTTYNGFSSNVVRQIVRKMRRVRATSHLDVERERPLIIAYSLHSENIMHYHFY